MATLNIQDVIDLWDKTHPNMEIERLREGKNTLLDGKIKFGKMYENSGYQAVIKLSPEFPCSPWGKRTCYAFIFQTKDKVTNINNLITDMIVITFERRIKISKNTEEFFKLLQGFNNFINGNKLEANQGSINKNHLTLSVNVDTNLTAENICDRMEQLINLTKNPIIEFLNENPN